MPAPSLTIRTAAAGDVHALRGIFRRAALSNHADRAALKNHPAALEWDPAPTLAGRTRVAVAGSLIVGFASIGPAAGVVELDDLFVDPRWMRRGVGTLLVHDVLTTARSLGATRVEVTASVHALAFYERMGFVMRGEVATMLGPAPRLVLELE